MSEVKEFKTEYKDADVLVAAATEAGFGVQRNVGIRTFGSVQSRARYDVVLTPHGRSYDIGFARAEDKGPLTAIADFDMMGGDQVLSCLRQLYAVHAAERVAKSKGYRTTRQTRADGSIKISVVVN